MRQQPGFSLIELMVVLVIMGVLAAMIAPKYMDRPDEARVIAAKQDIAATVQALKMYRLDNIEYPSTEQGLQALVSKTGPAAPAGQLEKRRLSRPPGERPLGPPLRLSAPRPPRRHRRFQLRRRWPGRRRRP